MNLERELFKKQSRALCDRIVKYIGTDKIRFSELVKLFFRGEYRLSQHAAWPISCCISDHPELIKPYFRKFIDHLSDQTAHPAARRNIVRLLQFVEIPKRYQGEIMDICFRFIGSPEEAVAVKAFSLRVLENFGEIYPEIFPELKNIIKARWDLETAAFRSRARRILKKAGDDKVMP